MRRVVVGFVALLAVVAGCGSTAGTPLAGRGQGEPHGAVVPGTAGFLHTDTQTVVFLQWPTDSSGNVNGTIKEDYVAGSASNQSVSDKTANFTGQIGPDGSVTMTFFGSWGTVYGTETGSTLTLNLPQQGGGLQAITFQAATPNDYNSALAMLQNSAGQANQQAQQQAQISKDQSALANDYAALGADAQSINADLDSLSQAVSNIDNETQIVSKEAAAAKAKGSGEQASGCGDVAVAGGDASSVGGDASAVDSYLQSLINGISSIRQDISSTSGDLGKVTSSDPGYAGTARAPAPADVQKAIASANSAIANAVMRANAGIDRTNGDVASAYSAVDAAAKATSCEGAGPPSPPIQHIS